MLVTFEQFNSRAFVFHPVLAVTMTGGCLVWPNVHFQISLLIWQGYTTLIFRIYFAKLLPVRGKLFAYGTTRLIFHDKNEAYIWKNRVNILICFWKTKQNKKEWNKPLHYKKTFPWLLSYRKIIPNMGESWAGPKDKMLQLWSLCLDNSLLKSILSLARGDTNRGSTSNFFI